MKKEIVREYEKEYEYNEKLQTIKNTLAGAKCTIEEYKEYENGTKKFYGKMKITIDQIKLTEERDKDLIELFEMLEEIGTI